jgi:hypothetical protein
MSDPVLPPLKLTIPWQSFNMPETHLMTSANARASPTRQRLRSNVLLATWPKSVGQCLKSLVFG